MPLSNSILRRYTPPTCTLEIVAKSSPLSRWVGQSVLKDLRFELRFDDPRKPEEERVTIRGERTDLDVLYDAVNNYVQNFLDPSPTQLSVALQNPDSIPDENSNRDSIPNRVSDSDRPAPVPPQSFEEELDEPDPALSVPSPKSNHNLRTLHPRTLATEIYLQPKSLLAHHLFLGRLATEESGPAIDLSVLQLFDLATALDEYAAEVVALPNLNKPLSWKKNLPTWTPTAAAVLLAVGVTAAGVNFLNQPKAKQQAAAPTTSQTPSQTGLPTLTSQVPPAPISPVPASPLPTPVLPPSVSSFPSVPPPTPVTGPLPTTLNSPLGDPRRTITLAPPSGNTVNQQKGSTSTVAPSKVGAGSTASAPTTEKAPTQQSTSNSTAGIPSLPPNAPSLAPKPSPASVADRLVPPPNTPSASAGATRPESFQARSAPENRLSDTIPQVAEVRNYLQQRWKPPSGLTQTLEYEVFLNTDGTVERIRPLNNAAVEHLNSANMPVPGDPFVSPVQGQGSPKIRVVFNPDGKVQTFLEK